LSAAETFRSRHAHIPVRILTTDPALPYAKPPLSKDYLCGRDAKLELHSAGWFVRNNVELLRGITVDHIDLANHTVVTAGGSCNPYWHLVLCCGATAVPLRVPGGESALTLRSFADAVALRMAARYADSAVVVGERVAKILSDNGVRFVGQTSVMSIDGSAVHLDTGATMNVDLIVSAIGVRPDPHLAVGAGLVTDDDRIVVDEHMHTSALNVYAAGDVALAHNVTAGRRVRAEHRRDAALQGRIAGLSAAGYESSWDSVPGFACTIGESILRYRGWGVGYQHSRLDEHRHGFTAWYEADGELVGVLTLNADEDHRAADRLLRAHTPMAS